MDGHAWHFHYVFSYDCTRIVGSTKYNICVQISLYFNLEINHSILKMYVGGEEIYSHACLIPSLSGDE